ncbi:MAG TPA: PD-(D/E)XK nuclease family protein, partial [Methanocorpusculum sp.]|nr:PD-(D/E)XK nuclease family protein [Methanocorpusculum sp.]
VTVSGRVDRVILRGSEFRVLDYKTGKPKNKSDVPKGLVLQLPAYTEGIAQETALTPLTGYYLQTSPTHVGVIDLFPDGADVMITEARERISEILASIRSGVCTAKPDCGVKYCAYRSICRNDDGGEND